ncbi:outer membrane beta-barrel protein [Dyadobacter jiangsuensis]|uniref:Outer membrane protein with beta-barrel domain n=1 Tax=Dyadobacter jiangsuensis TaxID=1591085 RepID=A0A2P8GBA5_9BACT|nr:outer membrane beta-barrel protein [Dyadobacter jiangsuensis]PSL31251.1 outer membrane protein with beta-barrel domain [Dyadobacter jiangsuensis]
MKAFVSIFVLVLLSHLAYAQQPSEDRQWRFGILAGSPVAGRIYEGGNTEWASGVIAGLDFSYDFEKVKSRASIHFQPAFVTFKKTEVTGEKNSQYYVESRWKWEAVHLPLFFRYTLPMGVVRPFVELGVNFRVRTAFTLCGSGSMCGIAGCTPVSSGGSIQNVTDKDKLGVLASAGVEVDAGKFTVPLTIRLVDSIIKKKYDDLAPGTPQLSAKTKLIQVTAGITF